LDVDRQLRRWHGAGIKASSSQAVEYARSAAAGGHVPAQVALGDWQRRLANSSADIVEAREWLQKAAASGDAVARLMLEREDWSPTKASAGQTMQWGSARYNDVGFEGWGCLPLANFADLEPTKLAQLAAEHSILPRTAGHSGLDQQHQVLSLCRSALTPRFVVTLHEDPWVGKLNMIHGDPRHHTAVTTHAFANWN
jgi:TPR repeat protein